MTTLRTVAERAGVSVMTVSRALNTPERVTENTRRRVLDAAAALNFVPDRQARAMRSGRSGGVGLIFDELAATPCSVDTARAIEVALSTRGYTLLMAGGGARDGGLTTAVRRLRASRVEGLIYSAGYHREVDLGDLGEVPRAVLVNCYEGRSRLPTILPDEEAGGHAAGAHLIGLGHRCLAALTLAPDIAATRLRLDGFRRALREAGLSPEGLRVAAGQARRGVFDRGQAYAAARSLLAAPNRPTGVFCGNDEMALQLYNAVRDLGLTVPDDISVVGYDDHHVFSEGLRPGLTTVALPYGRMGRLAVDLLLETEEVPGAPELIRVASPLVVRGSTSSL